MLWPQDHEHARTSGEERRRKRAFGLHHRPARLTSRPHVLARTAELRGLLSRQTERRDATYRALSTLLDAHLAAGPLHLPCRGARPFTSLRRSGISVPRRNGTRLAGPPRFLAG
jgi:hypothetical protein